MPPPNPLSIATSSLARLIREEASYHKEQEQQEAAITKLETQSEDKENEGEEGNREFTLTQQKKALAETKAIFPALHERILSAKENLEALMEQHKDPSDDDDQNIRNARQLLTEVKMLELSTQ